MGIFLGASTVTLPQPSQLSMRSLRNSMALHNEPVCVDRVQGMHTLFQKVSSMTSRRREKSWAKHSKFIPKCVFEILLAVMREATQQQPSMSVECSSSVYKNIDAALRSARDNMECDLQHAEAAQSLGGIFLATEDAETVSGDEVEGGETQVSDADGEESESIRPEPEPSSRKRIAQEVYMSYPKRMRQPGLGIHDAEE